MKILTHLLLVLLTSQASAEFREDHTGLWTGDFTGSFLGRINFENNHIYTKTIFFKNKNGDMEGNYQYESDAELSGVIKNCKQVNSTWVSCTYRDLIDGITGPCAFRRLKGGDFLGWWKHAEGRTRNYGWHGSPIK